MPTSRHLGRTFALSLISLATLYPVAGYPVTTTTQTTTTQNQPYTTMSTKTHHVHAKHHHAYVRHHRVETTTVYTQPAYVAPVMPQYTPIIWPGYAQGAAYPQSPFYQYYVPPIIMTTPMVSHPFSRDAFFQIANINSPRSYVPPLLCVRGDLLCISGLFNADARYYNNYGVFVSPAIGSRPVFTQRHSQYTGSLNNANIILDSQITDIVKFHFNAAYVNGSVKEDSYSAHWGADWGSVYRVPAGLKVDEAFVMFAKPELTPLYLKIGRFYSDFGEYVVYDITPTLTQLMTQLRAGGAQAGVVLPWGMWNLYGSGTWSAAEQTFGNRENFYNANHPEKNYGAKVGISYGCDAANFNTNLSFIADIRDTDLLNDNLYIDNTLARRNTDPDNGSAQFSMRRTPAIAFHADTNYGPLGATFEAARALGPISFQNHDSDLFTLGVDGNVDFWVLGHNSKFDLGWQMARRVNVIDYTQVPHLPKPSVPDPIFTILPAYNNILPMSRIVGTYTINIIKQVDASVQWVHDKDFAAFRSNRALGITRTSHGSDIGIIRIAVQF